MSVDPQELRATTADRADDEKTIQEEPTNDDGGDEELKKGIDQKGDPTKRSSSPSSDIQVSEKVESRENDFDEPPELRSSRGPSLAPVSVSDACVRNEVELHSRQRCRGHQSCDQRWRASSESAHVVARRAAADRRKCPIPGRQEISEGSYSITLAPRLEC